MRAGRVMQHLKVRRAKIGVCNSRHPVHAWNRLDQNVLPLTVEFRREHADPGGIAAWPGKRDN
jgi:hypothetical protein